MDLDGKQSIFVLGTELSWVCLLLPWCCGSVWCFGSVDVRTWSQQIRRAKQVPHQGDAEECFLKQRDVLGGCASGALPAKALHDWLSDMGTSTHLSLGTEPTPQGCLIQVASGV